MELPINQDPQTLNKSAFGGRKGWQWMCIVIAFAIAIAFTLFLGQKMDPTVNGIICAVLVVPLGYIGVFKKNGMDFFEFYREKKKNRQGNNCFYYVTDIQDYKQVD